MLIGIGLRRGKVLLLNIGLRVLVIGVIEERVDVFKGKGAVAAVVVGRVAIGGGVTAVEAECWRRALEL